MGLAKRVVTQRQCGWKLQNMAIGIFDSGLGGLTVFDAIQKHMPDLDIIYLGDHKHAPYGVRDADDIYRCTTQAVQILFGQGCDLVILACNTASAAALRRMQENWLAADKRVLGVFVPMIEALTERRWGDNSPPQTGGCAARRAVCHAGHGLQPSISARIGVPGRWCGC